ncbi:MAG: pyridoxamine 5'-phosphate oxidase family protein [Bacteroidetes bacterium]|nr:pyridoxamine 5'-phosphate oxidase family protein [Bacteroidota bacterium]
MEHNFHDEKDNIKNLSGKEAIDKLKELAEGARMCMFTTFTTERPMPSRPMALQIVENDGTLQFFSATDSHKNHQLENDPDVQLLFANSGSSEYLNVYGHAIISQDRAKIKELWSPLAKTWFQDGPEDPKLSLISVKPDSCEYWDTKHNKIVAYLKIAASIVTGKTMDDGVEGQLKLDKK